VTEQPLPPQLSDELKRQFCSMLLVGCDRETAGNYLGFSPAQLRDEVKRDPDFFRQMLRAEASAEFHQIRNLHEATKDSKQWRASVWWLERKVPERFARRAANAITESEWRQFLETLADLITSEIASEADRQRLLSRLSQIAQEVDADLAGSQIDAADATADEGDSTGDLDDESGET
jgi:hypothetical protein